MSDMTHELMVDNGQLREERDALQAENRELAAQYAVLSEALKHMQSMPCLTNLLGESRDDECGCARCTADRALSDIPAAAKALLDRLEQAEHEADQFQKAWAVEIELAKVAAERLAQAERERDEALRLLSREVTAHHSGITGCEEWQTRAEQAEARVERLVEALEWIRDDCTCDGPVPQPCGPKCRCPYTDEKPPIWEGASE